MGGGESSEFLLALTFASANISASGENYHLALAVSVSASSKLALFNFVLGL